MTPFERTFMDHVYPLKSKVPSSPVPCCWLDCNQGAFMFKYIRPLMHDRLIIAVVLALATLIAIALA